MRYFIPLALYLLLIPRPVYACLGPDSWNNLFFDAAPSPQPDADLVAVVSVSEKNGAGGGATITAVATIVQVLKSADTRIKPGKKITMQLENSSCGPDPVVGSKGLIIAKVTTDRTGRPVLHPYTYRSRDSLISPPVILPDGFDLRLKPISIGEEIPQGFAVVLVGLTGKTPRGSLAIDHSQTRFSMHASFPEQTNTIVAFAIPLGIQQLTLAGIGVRQWFDEKPSYTMMEKVLTQKIDIDKPGLYYTATLDTDNPGKSQSAPIPAQLKQFHTDFANTVGRLDAMNFKWPQ